MGKPDWSWKPDIHSNEPVIEVGCGRYLYDRKKRKRRVHEINPDTGQSYCKVENGSKAQFVRSAIIPDNRKFCISCDKIKRGDRHPITNREISRFYSSSEWAKIRYQVLKEQGRECVVCGATKNLTVDHIKPLRKYPELAKDITNLQVMCRLCNRGKGAWDQTDWRE